MQANDIVFGEVDGLFQVWAKEPIRSFEDGWQDIVLPPPPSNTSQQTMRELALIQSFLGTWYPERREDIERQDALELQPFDPTYLGTLETEFVVLLGSRYEDVPDDVRRKIAQIAIDLTTIGLHYKKLFNRPRPYQLFNAFGWNVVVPASETADSPAYPSTHALIGNFLGWYLGKLYPRHASALAALGKRLGDNRVVAGWHFPSDVEAGQVLAVALRDYLKT